MFGIFKIVFVLALICIVPLSSARRKARVKHGPTGMNINDSTTCEEFAKYARFNPYSVLDQAWFVFYYWGPPKTVETYIFTFPTANHTRHLHRIFDGNTILPINWTARHILMENKHNEITLLVERGDRGQYWGFLLQKVRKGQKIRPRDIRLKQTGDTKLIGLMDCDRDTVLAMCKLEEVPPKNSLQDEAARLGYRARRGKSYLYEGHEWMPIPEADEKHYWAPKKKEKSSEQLSNEVGSTSKEEVGSTSKEEVGSTSKEDLKKPDISLNIPKDQLGEDQSSQEQVDNKENNNQTNPEADEETNNKERSKELVKQNSKSSVTDSTDKTDNSSTNDEVNDINNITKKKEKKRANKPKPSQTLNEPEVVTDEEMELLTTSAPYTPQSSKTAMNKNLASEVDNCKTCFTLTQRRVESIRPKLKTPDPQNSLNNPTNSQVMETKHENKANYQDENVNDDDRRKDLDTAKNEV